MNECNCNQISNEVENPSRSVVTNANPSTGSSHQQEQTRLLTDQETMLQEKGLLVYSGEPQQQQKAPKPGSSSSDDNSVQANSSTAFIDQELLLKEKGILLPETSLRHETSPNVLTDHEKVLLEKGLLLKERDNKTITQRKPEDALRNQLLQLEHDFMVQQHSNHSAPSNQTNGSTTSTFVSLPNGSNTENFPQPPPSMIRTTSQYSNDGSSLESSLYQRERALEEKGILSATNVTSSWNSNSQGETNKGPLATTNAMKRNLQDQEAMLSEKGIATATIRQSSKSKMFAETHYFTTDKHLRREKGLAVAATNLQRGEDMLQAKRITASPSASSSLTQSASFKRSRGAVPFHEDHLTEKGVVQRSPFSSTKRKNENKESPKSIRPDLESSEDGYSKPESAVHTNQQILQEKGLLRQSTASNASITDLESKAGYGYTSEGSAEHTNQKVLKETGLLRPRPSNNDANSSELESQVGGYSKGGSTVHTNQLALQEKGLLRSRPSHIAMTSHHHSSPAKEALLVLKQDMQVVQEAAPQLEVAESPITPNSESPMDEIDGVELMSCAQLLYGQDHSMQDNFDEQDPTVGVAGVPGAHSVLRYPLSPPPVRDFRSEQANTPATQDTSDDSSSVETANTLEECKLAVAQPVSEEMDIEEANPYHPSAIKDFENETNCFKSALVMAVLIILLVMAVVAGSVCGSGHCGSKSESIRFNVTQVTNDSFIEPQVTSARELSLKYFLIGTFGSDYFGNATDNKEGKRNIQARLTTLHWLADKDPLQVDPLEDSDHFIQRYTLVLFYFHTSHRNPWRYCEPATKDQHNICFADIWGQNLERANRWLTEHECGWAGVYCASSDNARKVTSLHLPSNGINGNLPMELAMLTNLEFLDFSNNSLTGPIPSSLGELTSLTRLTLSSNKLTGTLPPYILTAPSLQSLSLSSNKFVSLIPSEVKDFKGETLLLDDNQLTGSLPAELFSLENLVWLHLHDNLISGTIPTEIGQLKQIRDFSLASNLLEGTIPSESSEIGSLSIHRYSLYFQSNFLVGSIPAEIYWQGTDLMLLYLQDCFLSGTISTHIGKLTGLGYFDISNNPDITGFIPSEIANLSLLQEVKVDGTNISGIISEEFCAGRNINSLNIEADCLEDSSTGTVPVTCPRGCCRQCCDRATGYCEDYFL